MARMLRQSLKKLLNDDVLADSVISIVTIEYKWLGTSEAAAYLGISTGNFRVKVSRGQIPVNGRLGKKWLFRRDELDSFIKASSK